MDFTYTNIDKFIRLSLGENAHFQCHVLGDFSEFGGGPIEEI